MKKITLEDLVTPKKQADFPHPLVSEVKQALNACASIAEVNTTVKHYGYAVALMDKKGGYFKTMAIQIRHLAQHRRDGLPLTRRETG